jgi:2-polyprenyl-3-methyl-5-hydroxy-6-metoxy-1,4-benzoquinol methylase
MWFALIVLIAILLACALWYWAETLAGMAANIAPRVWSSRRLRDGVMLELHGMKFESVCDLGSGWGGMCGRIAREFPSAAVRGFEIMPMPFAWSKVMRLLGLIPRRADFTRGDFFSLIKNGNGFDVCVCYQVRRNMPRIESELMDKFKVLLVLDFPLPNAQPAKKIKLHHDSLGQHYLYVYEK